MDNNTFFLLIEFPIVLFYGTLINEYYKKLVIKTKRLNEIDTVNDIRTKILYLMEIHELNIEYAKIYISTIVVITLLILFSIINLLISFGWITIDFPFK